jgi:hypothetical protein
MSARRFPPRLGVERMRAQAAPAQRIVDDADAGRKIRWPSRSLRKLVLRAIAVDGGGEMA